MQAKILSINKFGIMKLQIQSKCSGLLQQINMTNAKIEIKEKRLKFEFEQSGDIEDDRYLKLKINFPDKS